MPYYEPVILERRELGAFVLLTLHTPDLARATRPGQAVLVRCAPPGSADPLLRRTLFLAGADASAGVVTLLVAPEERGVAWLAAQPTGAHLDVYGPVGTGFTLAGHTRHLLLAGTGSGLPALLFLATTAVAREAAVMLLAAGDAALLPPPYLLPHAVEYQTSAADLLALLAPRVDAGTRGQGDKGRLSAPVDDRRLPHPPRPLSPVPLAPLVWADQVCLALEEPLVAGVADAVRAARLRWERGFATVALAGALPCGYGVCLACQVETKDGPRLRCKDGPVFDLRDLRV